MELIKAFLLIFLSVIARGCFIGDNLSQESKLCYALINKSGKRIGQKYGLSPSSIGAGGVYGLRLMILDFNRYGEPLTQEEARRLIVACAEEFLTDINSDESLKPYLLDYPFSPSNISLGIINYDSKGGEIFAPYISAVAASEGVVMYLTNVPGQLAYKDKIKETYEEALEKLKREKQKHTESSS